MQNKLRRMNIASADCDYRWLHTSMQALLKKMQTGRTFTIYSTYKTYFPEILHLIDLCIGLANKALGPREIRSNSSPWRTKSLFSPMTAPLLLVVLWTTWLNYVFHLRVVNVRTRMQWWRCKWIKRCWWIGTYVESNFLYRWQAWSIESTKRSMILFLKVLGNFGPMLLTIAWCCGAVCRSLDKVASRCCCLNLLAPRRMNELQHHFISGSNALQAFV